MEVVENRDLKIQGDFDKTRISDRSQRYEQG
jgi:hypothetical protein